MDMPSLCRTVGDRGSSCSEEVGLCSFVTGMGGGCPWGWDTCGHPWCLVT